MPLYDLIIRNGTVVSPGGADTADIAIAGGSVVEIAPAVEGALRHFR